MVTGELAQWLEDHKEECGKMALALMINQLKEETREDGRRQAFEEAAEIARSFHDGPSERIAEAIKAKGE